MHLGRRESWKQRRRISFNVGNNTSPSSPTSTLDTLNQVRQEAKGKRKFVFSFVEGPLAKAIRSGDWVLLDEVNLASVETLESLSTLLQAPDSSLVLTESQKVISNPSLAITTSDSLDVPSYVRIDKLSPMSLNFTRTSNPSPFTLNSLVVRTFLLTSRCMLSLEHFFRARSHFRF